MQKLYAALVLFVSFYSRAMDVVPSPASADLYDLIRYPVDAGTKIAYEQAKFKLAKNPHDGKSLKSLHALANSGYVPAMRSLASAALTSKDQDLNAALHWASRAAVQCGDAPSMHSFATMMFNHDAIPNLQNIDPLIAEMNGRQLLWQASQSHLLQAPDGRLFCYHVPGVADLLSTVLDDNSLRWYDALEKSASRLAHDLPDGEQAQVFLLLADLAETCDQRLAWCNDAVRNISSLMSATADIRSTPMLLENIIQLYSRVMAEGNKHFVPGLVTFLKDNTYKKMKESVRNCSGLSQELGLALLRLRDAAITFSDTARGDHRRIRDEGIEFLAMSAAQENVISSWALVEQCNNLKEIEVLLAEAIMRTSKALDQHYEEDDQQYQEIDPKQIERCMAKVDKISLSSDTYVVLGGLYMRGLERGIPVDRQKAIGYFAKACDGAQKLFELLQDHHLVATLESRICFEAACLLHSKKDEKFETLQTQLLARVVFHEDIALRKDAIRYCLEHEDLLSSGIYALREFHKDYVASPAEQARAQDSFNRETIGTISKWAMGTRNSQTAEISQRHPAAIMLLHEISRNDNDQMLVPIKKTIQELVEWAAFKTGFAPAIEALEPEFECVPQEKERLEKSIDFWHTWWKKYADDPVQRDKKNSVYQKLLALSDAALVPLANKEDGGGSVYLNIPSVHYRIATIFMQMGDELKALVHIVAAEQLVRSMIMRMPQAGEQVDKLGALDLIKAAANQGKDWARYAWALIRFNRVELLLEGPKPEQMLDELDAIKTLISGINQAAIPEADDILKPGEMDFYIAFFGGRINQRLKVADQKINARVVAALEAAIAQDHCQALYTWAMTALNQAGRADMGQATLEKAVDYLCRATILGHGEAPGIIRTIKTRGFGFISLCGGAMTAELLTKIEATLAALPAPTQNTLSDVHTDDWQPMIPESDEPEPLPADPFERATKLLHTKKYSDAFGEFSQLAAQQHVGAYSYLGAMYRDGLHVEKSAEGARDYFMRALRESNDAHTRYIGPLIVAYQALRDDPSLEVQMLRLKHNVHVLNSNHVSGGFEELLDHLRTVEVQNPGELLCTTGLLPALNNFSAKNCKNVAWLLNLVGIWADRLIIHGWPDLNKYRNEFYQLVVPFDLLREQLENSLLSPDGNYTSILGDGLDAQSIVGVIVRLETLVQKGYHDPFEGLLGELKIIYGLETMPSVHGERSIKEGLEWLKHTQTAGVDVKAGVLLGRLQLSGIAKIKVIMGIGLKTEALRPNPEAGKAVLLDLVKKGNAGAAVVLGKWHYCERKEPEPAIGHFKKALEITPNTPEAAFNLLSIYCERPSLAKKVTVDTLRSLVATAQTLPKHNLAASFYKSYFTLAKGMPVVSEEEALETIIAMCCRETDMKAMARAFVEILGSNFYSKLQGWIDTVLERPETPERAQLLSRGYRACASMAFINYGDVLCKMPSKAKIYSQECIAFCDKAIAVWDEYAEAMALKVWYQHLMGDKKDAEQKIATKKSLVRLALTMQKKGGLKLSTFTPAMRILADLKNAWQTETVVLGAKEIAELQQDLEFVKMMEEKYC